MSSSGPAIEARILVAGEAEGEALVLSEPLSFWGGFDPDTGRVIDRRHPQHGENAAGRILVMPSGRGSSSSSSVLAEAVRAGTAPAAILLRDPDHILVLGSLVAEELYGQGVPIAVVASEAFALLRTGHRMKVTSEGVQRRD